MTMQARNPNVLSQHDPGNYYQQVWLPCTRHETINHYLSRLRFPTSFRGLCEQWRSLGKPHLVNLRYPEGLQYGVNSGVPQNLEVLSFLQEIMTLSIFAGYMRENIVPTPRPFSEIASHMHIYCSLKVELAHRMYQFTKEQQDSAYERQWRALQDDFYHDRAFCQSLARHDCIGYLLYGEVYHLSRESISQRYHQFQLSSPRNNYQFLPINLIITSPARSQQPNNNQIHNNDPLPLTSSPVPLSSPNNNIALRYSSNSMLNNSHGNMQSRPMNSSALQTGSTFGTPLRTYSEDSSMSPERGTPSLPLSIHQSFLSSPSLWQQKNGSGQDSSKNSAFFQGASMSNIDGISGGGGASAASTSTESIQLMSTTPSNSSLLNNNSNSNNSHDSRAEQNRQKSKRHYERKKLQRSLLYDLVMKMESTLSYLLDHGKGHLPVCRAIHEALTTPLPTPDFLLQVGSSSSSEDPLLQQTALLQQNSANEKKKLNKKVQNHLEMHRIVQISQTARILHPNAFNQSSIKVPVNANQEQSISGNNNNNNATNNNNNNEQRHFISTSTQILLSHTQEEVESIHKSIIFEPQDAFLLNWLHVRNHWDELVAAENRLSKMEEKPIARLITYLTAASTASNAAGPSSVNQNQYQNQN